MPKNDPVASDQTLPYTPPPSNKILERVRLGIDRVRLWVRGVTDVKLADQDLVSLEIAAKWLRENRMLTPKEVAIISKALRNTAALMEGPLGDSLEIATLEQVRYAREVLDGDHAPGAPKVSGWCSTCRAEPGEPCTGGGIIVDTHAGRP